MIHVTLIQKKILLYIKQMHYNIQYHSVMNYWKLFVLKTCFLEHRKTPLVVFFFGSRNFAWSFPLSHFCVSTFREVCEPTNTFMAGADSSAADVISFGTCRCCLILLRNWLPLFPFPQFVWLIAASGCFVVYVTALQQDVSYIALATVTNGFFFICVQVTL